ncbi:hypothetical protein ACEPPN_014972 [Leptodophora sp. 'Broadleaf-Isolate-01']
MEIYKTRKRKSKDNFVKIRVSNITSNGQTEAVEFSQSFQFAEDHKSEIREILNEFAPHSKGLLLVTIEGITPWLQSALCSSFKSLSEGLLDFFSPSQRATYGKAVLPTFCGDDIEFAIENLDMPENKKGLSAGQAIWTPFSTWCCSRDFLPGHPDIPVIFIMSTQDIGIHERLSQYYSEDQLYRFRRLRELPHWIFADLFSFTQWDRVWSATFTHINRLRDEVYGDKVALPILEQTRALHKFKEAIINQKECLRVHVAFTDAYQNSLSQLKDRLLGGDKSQLASLNRLIQKMDAIKAHLKHHQLSSERHLRSMEDLLNIAFNLETVAQGLQFKRLNYLAVVFLPLSLVAAVFGMNNTGLQPAVYPRYAFPVLLGTIVLGFTSGKVISWCEKRWARGARALEAKLLDEESSGSYSVQPQKEHHQRQRSQSRRRPPTASTVNDKLWEAGLPDPRRVSDSQWKIINGIPAPSLQPPIRIASESERGRQHHEPVTIVYPARVKTPRLSGPETADWLIDKRDTAGSKRGGVQITPKVETMVKAHFSINLEESVINADFSPGAWGVSWLVPSYC